MAQGGLPSLPPVVLKAVVVFAALVVLWLLIRAFIRWRYKARRRKRLRQVEERERRAAEKKAAQRPPVIQVSEPRQTAGREPAAPQLSDLWSVLPPAVSPSARTASCLLYTSKHSPYPAKIHFTRCVQRNGDLSGVMRVICLLYTSRCV